MDEHSYIYDLLLKAGLSDFAARTGEFLLVRPFKIALLVLAGIVAARMSARGVRRFLKTVHLRSPVRMSSVRADQRMGTVGNVLAGMVRIAVAAVVALLILGELGVDLGPFLAGAGIAGLAIGFGAQTLVKDFISGLFVLMEDQYGVGDVIDIGDVTGTVEDLTLRMTRLRDAEGTVWFVPNSEIKKVGRELSRSVAAPPPDSTLHDE